MNKRPLPSLRIDETDRELSTGQKTFNRQLQQIEKLRARLALWETTATAYWEKYTRELLPLVEAAKELQVKLVFRMDHAAAQKGLSRTELNMLDEMIADLAGQLLGERDDAELKAIYHRHADADTDTDFDGNEAARSQNLKDLFERMFDLDRGGETELDTLEETLRRAQKKFEEQQALFEAEQQARKERRAKRKKSAKQQEKEAQAEADAKQISLSVREIYRKLASALHPDREADPRERERKTALMQRINQAYDKRDLLQLLELQLELEHIDQSAIGKLDEGRLQHYNAILKEQVAELKQELVHVESNFRAQFGISPFVAIKPETVVQRLAHDIVRVHQGIREMEHDLFTLTDTKGTKAWLKKIRHQSSGGFDGIPF